MQWRFIECPYKNDIYFFEYKNNFAIVHIFLNEKIKRLNILYTYYTDKSEENELFILITNWAISNDIDLVWAVNKNTGFENIFPKLFNKSLNFASWSSNKMISETLQNGLSDPQGVDSDLDSSLYVE